MLAGVLASAGSVGLVALAVAGRGSDGLFNDFYDYWAAARLLNLGGDPYSLPKLRAVQAAAGLHLTPGQGYSYPLLFVEVLRPLALLPAFSAALLFAAAGAVAFGIGVALVARHLRLRPRRAVLLGALAAAFVPAAGSLYFGQANLLVFLALAVAPLGGAEAAGIAVATAVKVYPGAAVLAQLAQRRWRAAGLTTAGALTLVLIPAFTGPGRGFLSLRGQLTAPDTYWSNQSLNGMVSRLGLASSWTTPPFPGLPVVPVALGLAGLLLVAATLWVARAGHRHRFGGLALLLAAASVAAPKASAWNLTPVLFCIFLLAAGRARRGALAVGLAGYLLIEAQAPLNIARESIYRASPWLSFMSSAAVFGCLLLVLAVAVELPSLPGDDVDRAEVDDLAVVHVQDSSAELGLHRHPG